MDIQRCTNCSNPFSWKIIEKSIWNGFKPIKCIYCGSKLYLPNLYRWIFAIVISLPILYQAFIGSLVKSLLYFQIIWIAIITWVAPYLLRYTLKNIQK